jgi:hypothetical protein
MLILPLNNHCYEIIVPSHTMTAPATASSNATAGPADTCAALAGTTVGLVCPWLTGAVAVGSTTGAAAAAGVSVSGVATGACVTGAAEFEENHIDRPSVKCPQETKESLTNHSKFLQG